MLTITYQYENGSKIKETNTFESFDSFLIRTISLKKVTILNFFKSN